MVNIHNYRHPVAYFQLYPALMKLDREIDLGMHPRFLVPEHFLQSSETPVQH